MGKIAGSGAAQSLRRVLSSSYHSRILTCYTLDKRGNSWCFSSMGKILRRTCSHKTQALETSGTCRHRPRVFTRGPVIDSTALFPWVCPSVIFIVYQKPMNALPHKSVEPERHVLSRKRFNSSFHFFTKRLWLISCKIMANPQLGNTDSQNARKLSTIEPLLGSVSPIVSILLVQKVDVWKGQSARKG